jgi:hypothetical protein
MPNSAPSKSPKTEEPDEMEDTEVYEDEEDEETDKPFKKKNLAKENFTMSAFENLFKKTLMEQEDQATDPIEDMEVGMDGAGEETPEDEIPDTDEESEEELEEEEGDLISDLRDLQDKLAAILDKLENIQSSEEELDGEYSEEQFDDEFGEDETEESPVKESKTAMKVLSPSKGKSLQHKKNKVGRVSPKGGKAKSANLRTQSNPSALGDKKKSLQHGNKVRSNISKGDFFK